MRPFLGGQFTIARWQAAGPCSPPRAIASTGHRPQAPGSLLADTSNAATKFVATHRPASLAWAPFQAFGPDLVDGVRPIISQDGPEPILWGYSTLTSTLLEQGLANEVGPTVVNK